MPFSPFQIPVDRTRITVYPPVMIPRVDPRVKHVGSSYLRRLKAEKLREMDGLLVVGDSSLNPLVVIVPFDAYLKIQAAAGIVPKEENGVSQQELPV